MFSPAFWLRCSEVIDTTAVAPTGITVPFAPITGSAICAVKRSPTLLVLVQMRWPAASEISDPDDTTPRGCSDPRSLTRSVLPVAVTWTAGVSGGAGAGFVVTRGAGFFTTAAVTRRGAGAGAAAGSETMGAGSAATGTSRSSGFEAVSWFASARSRVRLVSSASTSLFFASLHAPRVRAAIMSAPMPIFLFIFFLL